MRPLEEARQDVLAGVSLLPTARVGLDRALGLVLADPVVAPHDVPPFANSAMDGYAVRSSDLVGAPVVLRVSEDLPAGHVAAGSVEPGTAIRIMTGAPLPPGADAVVRVEDTEATESGVVIKVMVAPGTAIRERGNDVAAGEVVVPGRQRLTPAMLGVLAAVGVSRPTVIRRPRVAILSTGDEVVPPETATLEPGMIRDSNRPTLAAMLAELGVEVVDFGIVGDDAGRLTATLAAAGEECDAVLTTGGVSMGEYDLVKQVLADLGIVDFWQVAMKPGKPFAFGFVGGTPLFGLPGNPVSVIVAFEQFARPALLTMMGADRVLRPRIEATLDERVVTDPAKTVFLRGATRQVEEGWAVRMAGGQDSNMLSAVAAGDGFVVVPRGVGSLDPGSAVMVEMFRWPESRPFERGVA